MSSTFTKNNKKLSGIKVVHSNDAWNWNPKTKRKDILNPSLHFFGKVDTENMSSMVLKANRKDKKATYVDDVSSLGIRTKKDLVNHFYDDKGKRNKNKVAYLVRTDSKSKTPKQKPKKQKEFDFITESQKSLEKTGLPLYHDAGSQTLCANCGNFAGSRKCKCYR